MVRARREGWLRRVGLVVVMTTLFASARPTAAQPQEPTKEQDAPAPAPAPPPPPVSPELEQAKDLFRQGLALQKAGDCERALAYFLRSRALVASVPNTLNAANCLADLGRSDEALELYEALLTTLRDELTAEERAWLGPQMARLRTQVGSLEVIGDTDADLVVEGRLRGRLPLVAPVRIMPGRREVRLLKSGFRPHVVEVNIVAGETATIRATLEPLTVAGRLRVEAVAGAEVVVDGAPVGTSPWEGVLAPGRHYVQVLRGDEGSAPVEVTVVTGQLASLAPPLAPLGPELRVSVSPREAHLQIGGVRLGQGRWQGRLPVGDHQLQASEEGYLPHEERVVVERDGRSRAIRVKLVADEAHPRWATPSGERGKFALEVVGGMALTPSLGSDAERCDGASCEAGLALGFLAGARAGYELPFGLSFELLGGYLAVERAIDRRIADAFVTREPAVEVATRYTLESQLRVSGAFVGGGLGFRQPLLGPLELGAHLAVGAWFTSSRHRVEGVVEAGASRDSVGVGGTGESARGVDLFVAPELRLGMRFGDFGFGLGLIAAFLTLDGPSSALGDVLPRGACDPEGAPTAASCAPGESFLAGERSYGPAVLFIPSLSASYLF